MSIEMVEVEAFNSGTMIKVIGVGGGGGNAVEHMINTHVQGVEFICANTDAQALRRSAAHKVIQLGQSGLGAGSRPERGRDAAMAAEEDIRAALEGAHMLFITAGMGGGTGTGAAPVVARIAREMNILTVGVVTKPFEWEGGRRLTNAEAGLSELEANVDSLIVVLNEKLQQVLGEEVTQDQAFAFANDVLKNSVGGIAEIINVEALVNVDFEDVRTVMSEHGKAMMGTAKASGPDRARIAAEQAVACPLLEGVDAGVVKRAEESAAAVYETAARIRNLKAACGLPARRDLGFVLKPSAALLGRELATLGVLAGAGSIVVDGEYVKGRNTAGALTPLGEVYLPLTGLIDIEAERARLGKELERVQGEVAKVDAKLGSESFVSRAPEEVVEEHRQRRADWLTQSSQLGEMLRNLG